jgi:hypothetical protein
MSDEDEEVISRLGLEGADAAYLALRTCKCGAVIDGFDEYHEHLRREFIDAGASSKSGR